MRNDHDLPRRTTATLVEGEDMEENGFNPPPTSVSIPGRKKRRWAGVVVLLTLGTAVILIIIVLALLPQKVTSRDKKKLSLKNITSGAFATDASNMTWLSDTELAFYDGDWNIVIYDVETRNKTIIISNDEASEFWDGDFFEFSPDQNFLLLGQQTREDQKLDHTANYFIYDCNSKDVIRLELDDELLEIQHIAWGLDSSQLVFVYQNDLYYMENATVGVNGSMRLTYSGIHGQILNGLVPGEIDHNYGTISWSPDGAHLVFVAINVSLVPNFSFPLYGSYLSSDNVYTHFQTNRFAKTGHHHGTPLIYLADLETGETTPIDPGGPSGRNFYVRSAPWIDNEQFLLETQMDTFNHSLVRVCSKLDEWKCHVSLDLKSSRGWLPNSLSIIPSTEDGMYFVIMPSFQGEPQGHYMHVATVELITGNVRFLTRGQFDVTETLFYNEVNRVLYYTATIEGAPSQKHLHAVSLSGSSRCLSCHLDGSPSICLSSTAELSWSYYLVKCAGPDVPWSGVYRISDDKVVEILNTHAKIKEDLESYVMPEVQDLKVPIDGGYKAAVRVWLPPQQRSHGKSIPLLIEVYAGPESQHVHETFGIHWGHYLTTVRGWAYARIDGRGTRGQGEKFRLEVYRRLGTVEIEDQVAAARYLLGKYSFLDPSRVAIWGTSYGGFASLHALILESSVIECAVAVSAVTNFLYYNSEYAEMYMGKPSENKAGYKRANLLDKGPAFRGKKLLLVHGTGDDNVHFQHAAMLMKALNEHGILYQTQVYPDENHYLENVAHHQFRTMERFLAEDCFNE